ncbi:MAG: sugar ABC transporter ATP-binding protein [Actinobacteria bacterium]|nr:sugar ABC transporter ATP-binding protein [Actinomycetota bacterium]
MEDLKMEHISKSFGQVKALVDADFVANCGEVHALLGENGAGKSTLIKILSRVIKEDSGKVILFGKPLSIKGPNDAIKAGISTVFQELSLIPDLNVATNIFFGHSLVTRFGITNPYVLIRKAQKLFDQYEVSEIDPKAMVSELPLSQRQLIEIIKVLARDPKVLILDEATSALTEDKVKWLLKIARFMAKDGKIVIFISHRMAEVKEVADRVTVFRNGENVGTLAMKETDSDELISLMLGRKVKGYFPEKKSIIQKEVVLETRQLSCGHFLIDVDLKLHAGEILGVGGLAGQGQDYLFLSLFGLYKTTGNILINNKVIRIKNPRDSLNYGIALVPEDRGTQGLILSLSVKENVILPLLGKLTRYGLISNSKVNELVMNLIKKLEIKVESPETLVMNLSGGNQQKVVIAKFLSTKPKILLMYDITRGVDVGTKVEIFNMIQKMAADGDAILYYSTTIDELVNICDSVLVMYDSQVKVKLNGANLTKENIIRASVGEIVNHNGMAG